MKRLFLLLLLIASTAVGQQMTVTEQTTKDTVRFVKATQGLKIPFLVLNEVVFTGAISSLNGLTGATQIFATGTSGTDFAISSSGTTHTFNIPTASAANRGLLSTADWTTFNGKENVLTFNSPLSRATNTISADTSTATVGLTTLYQNSLKANIASPIFTGTVTIPTPFTLGAVSVTATGTELNYVAGVTSAIQTQLDAKKAASDSTRGNQASYVTQAQNQVDSLATLDSLNARVPNYRTLTAGYGISTLGDLSADRTIAFDSANAKASTSQTGLLSDIDYDRIGFLDGTNSWTGANTFKNSFTLNLANPNVYLNDGTQNATFGVSTTANQIITGSAAGDFNIRSAQGKINFGVNIVQMSLVGSTGNFGIGLTPSSAERFSIKASNSQLYAQLWFRSASATQVASLDTTGKAIFSAADITGNVSLGATGQFLAPAGSASVPGFSFTGATDYGMYKSGTDSLSITVSGVQSFLFKYNDDHRSINAIRVPSIKSAAGSIAIADNANTSWRITGRLDFSSDNTDDIGISTGFRPANIYAATSLNVQKADNSYAFTADTNKVTVGGYTVSDSLYGSTASGGDLYLFSTSHATKGQIFAGSTGSTTGFFSIKGTNTLANLFELYRSDSSTAIARIDTSGNYYAGNGSVGTPSISFSSDPNTGIFGYGNDILSMTTGGVEQIIYQQSGIFMNGAGELSFTNGEPFTGSPDVRLFRDAANIFAQRNGTNAQTFRWYRTYTSGSVNAYAALSSSGNNAIINTVGNNSISPGLQLQTKSTDAIVIDTTQVSTITTLKIGGTDKAQIDSAVVNSDTLNIYVGGAAYKSPSFSANAGTATIGDGDSVQVSITGLTTSGVAVVSYKTASALPADTVASWNVHATNTLSLYGKFGWVISYFVGKK